MCIALCSPSKAIRDVIDNSNAPEVLKDPSSQVSYDICHLIGEGGFSKVLLVRAKDGHFAKEATGKSSVDKKNSRRALTSQDARNHVFAAKIIPKSHLKSAGSSFIKATMLERKILGEFNHPFVLKLYHAFQERDRLILVLDYCPGGSLHTHVNISLRDKGAGFPEARALFYVAEIAMGLGHLHQHGIVHRDLKLENVLMYATGHCAISDFGASKRLTSPAVVECRPFVEAAPAAEGEAPRPPDKDGAAQALARGAMEKAESFRGLKTEGPTEAATRSVVGTPAYMAPEMLLSQPYSFSVDWWGLGVLLYTMLKGRLPFDSSDEDKMLWRIVKARPRYDADWSAPMIRTIFGTNPHDRQVELLRLLLQKRPSTRLANLRDLTKAEAVKGMDWAQLEKLKVKPPLVPTLDGDERKYVPKSVVNAPVDLTLDYKKGDSMKKLFTQFSHRGSFDCDALGEDGAAGRRRGGGGKSGGRHPSGALAHQSRRDPAAPKKDGRALHTNDEVKPPHDRNGNARRHEHQKKDASSRNGARPAMHQPGPDDTAV